MKIGTLITVREYANQYSGRTGVIIDKLADGRFVVEIDGMGNAYPYAFYKSIEICYTTVKVKKISHHPRAWL